MLKKEVDSKLTSTVKVLDTLLLLLKVWLQAKLNLSSQRILREPRGPESFTDVTSHPVCKRHQTNAFPTSMWWKSVRSPSANGLVSAQQVGCLFAYPTISI